FPSGAGPSIAARVETGLVAVRPGDGGPAPRGRGSGEGPKPAGPRAARRRCCSAGPEGDKGPGKRRRWRGAARRKGIHGGATGWRRRESAGEKGQADQRKDAEKVA